MYVYIAHRNLMHYYSQNAACGGVPTNNDYRFTLANKGPNYLITLNSANYAVYKAEGDKFIEEVLSKCPEEHPGFFPMAPSLNGKETAAVVEIEREVDRGGHTRKQIFYCDMDDEVLLHGFVHQQLVILEHDAYALAAQPAQCGQRHCQRVLPVQQNPALWIERRRTGQKPGDAHRNRALAGA